MSEEKKETVLAYKGFDENLQCRGFQYEIGKTYNHDGDVKICQSGFHACEFPLDIFSYYDPANTRFAAVELTNPVTEHEGNTKIASAEIHIKAELSLPEIINKSVDWILSKINESKKESDDYSAASNTGNRSAASNTGNYSAASNTGDYSAASNTGDYSAASNTGYQSAASVAGKNSVAMATGRESKAMASEGSAIVLCNYDDDGKLRHIKSAIAGQGEIKPDTWYTLDSEGNFKETI